MLADVLEANDIAILNSAMSADPLRKDAARTRPITPPEAQAERSFNTGFEAVRGTATGVLVGATFWLVIVVVAFIGH